MKKLFVLFLMMSVSFVSCKEVKKSDKKNNEETTVAKAEATETKKYDVNTSESVINWKGFKPTGEHYGTLAIKSGSFQVNNGKLIGGKFVIDMESMKVTDIPVTEEGNAKLLGHLKNADFFDVSNHKEASFEILSVNGNEVNGILTIKGISKAIKFNASVNSKDGKVQFVSEKFNFNRTDYGIKYKSKSFFDNLKDKFINDEIEISFDVKAA